MGFDPTLLTVIDRVSALGLVELVPTDRTEPTMFRFLALERGDDSVLDLYVPEGYHLYGDKRFEYDEIVGHLSEGNVEHEWITGPLLIAEDEDGRYVVVRGMRNTSPIWSNASALMFEIVTTPDDQLRFVQTAWFYDSEW